MKTAVQAYITTLSNAIEACEQCITACQNVTSFCAVEENVEYVAEVMPADSTECAPHLGVLVKTCTECISACEHALALALELMKNCNDVSCIVILERVVTHAKETIHACKECIAACKTDGDCFTKTDECMKSCKRTALTIDQALDIVDDLAL